MGLIFLRDFVFERNYRFNFPDIIMLQRAADEELYVGNFKSREWLRLITALAITRSGIRSISSFPTLS